MLKTKYPEIEKLVLELGDLIKSTLGTKIHGLYLFGSLATDDFDPKTSDIDLLAIVESKITDLGFAKLKNMHQDAYDLTRGSANLGQILPDLKNLDGMYST
jgi:predicted nucleotidyltransferase